MAAKAIALGMTTAAVVRPATKSKRSHPFRYEGSQPSMGMGVTRAFMGG